MASLGVRMSEQEYADFQSACEQEGLSQRAFIARIVQIHKRGLIPGTMPSLNSSASVELPPAKPVEVEDPVELEEEEPIDLPERDRPVEEEEVTAACEKLGIPESFAIEEYRRLRGMKFPLLAAPEKWAEAIMRTYIGAKETAGDLESAIEEAQREVDRCERGLAKRKAQWELDRLKARHAALKG